MKLAPPKSNLRAPSNPGFPDHSLVSYENEGQLLAGAVIGFRRQRYVILNERGREVELTANRLHPIPGNLPLEARSIEERKNFLAELASGARAQAPKIDLSELWNVVQSDPKEYSVPDLFELSFGEAPKPTNAQPFFALWAALTSDKINFKRDRDGFLPRSAAAVEELRKAESARVAKLAKRSVFFDWVRERIRDAAIPAPPDLAETIELLEEVAAGAPHLDNTRHREAKEIIDNCIANIGEQALGGGLGGNREQRAFRLLERIGWITERTNLSLIRHHPPRRFSAETLRETEALRIPESVAGLNEPAPGLDATVTRIDLTDVFTFTIDDITTADMDDAISLERQRDGYRLGIHISDVSSFIAPGGVIDRAARFRATSLYLPDQNVPMLPELLSEDRLSLKQGAIRPVLSCLIQLDESLKFQSAKLQLCTIKSARRFNYDEFERLLEDPNSEFGKLYELSSALEQERIEHGAHKVYKRDLVIDVDEAGHCSLREIDEHGPARALIGELMILANSLSARYAAEHNIPVVFRRQDPPDSTGQNHHHAPERSPQTPGKPTDSVPGPAADYAERSRMKKSSIGVDRGPHSGLGLEAYIQSTSPIRRYIDLVNQRQIVHHLVFGKPWYSRQEVEEIIAFTEQPLGVALTVSRESRRFWLLRYLANRMAQAREDGKGDAGSVITGTVLRTDLKHPLVELDEIFMPVMVKCALPPKVGDHLKLKIVGIDPQQDYIRLEPIVGPDHSG